MTTRLDLMKIIVYLERILQPLKETTHVRSLSVLSVVVLLLRSEASGGVAKVQGLRVVTEERPLGWCPCAEA